MDYNEAKKHLGVMGKFYQSLRVIGDILETAEIAEASAKTAKAELESARTEASRITSENEGIRQQLADSRKTLAAKMAEVQVKADEKYAGIVAGYEAKIEEAQKGLAEWQKKIDDLVAHYNEVAANHETKMQVMKDATKAAEAKLAAAEKAYEAFKKKIA